MKHLAFTFVISILTCIVLLAQPQMGTRLLPSLYKKNTSPSTIQSNSFGTSTNIQVFPSNNDQTEMSISVSPSSQSRMLIGSNNSAYGVGYFYTTDGGITWAGSEQLPGVSWGSDPAVAFDASNDAYYNYLDYSTGTWVLTVKKSTDNGQTWASAGSIPNYGDPDKNHMAVDGSNVYVGWTDFHGGGSCNQNGPYPVKFAYSNNSASSFTTLANPISGSTVPDSVNALGQGVNLAVRPNGYVYAVWSIYDNFCNSPENAIGFNYSTDNGGNWGTAKIVATVQGIRGDWNNKNPLNEPIRVNSFTSMAIDKSGGTYNGYIYVVWANKGAGSDRSDIYFIRSTDGGATWTTPLRVNDDNTTNDQWFPWITVGSNGLINITFYDSRNDPNNQQTETWVAQSPDGGSTFTNYKVSDGSFTPYPISGSDHMGDYIGISSVPHNSFSVWMSYTSNGKYQAFVSNRLLELASSNESADYGATGDNHNRLLSKGNNLYETFASGGEIFVRQSSNNGTTWNYTSRVSSGNGDNSNPSIVAYPVVGTTDTVNVVWEQSLGSNYYNIYYAMSDNSGASWSVPVELVSSVLVSTYQYGGPQPVIAGITSPPSNPPFSPTQPLLPASYMHEVLVVYTSNSGLKYMYNYFYPNWIWTPPASISTSAPANYIWYPSLASQGGNTVPDATLSYDARYYHKIYSNYFDAPTDSWSKEQVVYDGTAAQSYDRQSCIAVNGYIYDAWNSYNNSAGYYTVKFRQGIEPDTWENWEWTYQGTSENYFFPSISSYNNGSNVAITDYSSPGNQILLHKADITNKTWTTYTVGSNADFPVLPNLNNDSGTSSPVEVWTGTAVNNIYPLSISSQNLPKQSPSAAEHFEIYDRALSSDNLRIELGNIHAVTTQGQNVNIPFKDFDYTKQADLSDPWQYLETGNKNTIAGVNTVKFNYSISTANPKVDSLQLINSAKPMPLKNIVLGVYNGNQLVLEKNITTTGASINGTAEVNIPDETLVDLKPVFRIEGNDNKDAKINFTTIDNIIPSAAQASQNSNSSSSIPTVFALKQIYPNPFNPSTIISYDLPEASHVALKVYDIIGREVATLYNGNKQAGTYNVLFNASRLASGVYFYQLYAVSFVATKKLMLLK